MINYLNRVVIFSIAMALLSTQLNAATMTKMDVERKGKRYYLDSTLIVDAPVKNMYAVLADYNSLHQFSRGIIHTQDITPDSNGLPRVYTHIYGCVAFFCRSIEKVERIEIVHNKRIVTTLDPEASKGVAWNITSWELSSVKTKEQQSDNQTQQQEQTQINYQMEFEPDFWVPPFLGNYMIKKSLRKDGIEIMERMEKHAQGRYPIDPKKNTKKLFPQFKVEYLDVNYSEEKSLEKTIQKQDTPIKDKP